MSQTTTRGVLAMFVAHFLSKWTARLPTLGLSRPRMPHGPATLAHVVLGAVAAVA